MPRRKKDTAAAAAAESPSPGRPPGRSPSPASIRRSATPDQVSMSNAESPRMENKRASTRRAASPGEVSMSGAESPRTENKRGRGRPKKVKNRGRPQGARNKKKLGRPTNEALDSQDEMSDQPVSSVKRRPGRPAGAKNKKRKLHELTDTNTVPEPTRTSLRSRIEHVNAKRIYSNVFPDETTEQVEKRAKLAENVESRMLKVVLRPAPMLDPRASSIKSCCKDQPVDYDIVSANKDAAYDFVWAPLDELQLAEVRRTGYQEPPLWRIMWQKFKATPYDIFRYGLHPGANHPTEVEYQNKDYTLYNPYFTRGQIKNLRSLVAFPCWGNNLDKLRYVLMWAIACRFENHDEPLVPIREEDVQYWETIVDKNYRSVAIYEKAKSRILCDPIIAQLCKDLKEQINPVPVSLENPHEKQLFLLTSRDIASVVIAIQLMVNAEDRARFFKDVEFYSSRWTKDYAGLDPWPRKGAPNDETAIGIKWCMARARREGIVQEALVRMRVGYFLYNVGDEERKTAAEFYDSVEPGLPHGPTRSQLDVIKGIVSPPKGCGLVFAGGRVPNQTRAAEGSDEMQSSSDESTDAEYHEENGAFGYDDDESTAQAQAEAETRVAEDVQTRADLLAENAAARKEKKAAEHIARANQNITEEATRGEKAKKAAPVPIPESALGPAPESPPGTIQEFPPGSLQESTLGPAEATLGHAPRVIPDSSPAPIPESAPGPVPEGAPAPIPESAPGPDPGPVPEGAPGTIPESAPGPAPGPVPECAPGTTPEYAPGPTPESASGPAPESASEPTPGPAPGPTLAHAAKPTGSEPVPAFETDAFNKIQVQQATPNSQQSVEARGAEHTTRKQAQAKGSNLVAEEDAGAEEDTSIEQASFNTPKPSIENGEGQAEQVVKPRSRLVDSRDLARMRRTESEKARAHATASRTPEVENSTSASKDNQATQNQSLMPSSSSISMPQPDVAVGFHQLFPCVYERVDDKTRNVPVITQELLLFENSKMKYGSVALLLPSFVPTPSSITTNSKRDLKSSLQCEDSEIGRI